MEMLVVFFIFLLLIFFLSGMNIILPPVLETWPEADHGKHRLNSRILNFLSCHSSQFTATLWVGKYIFLILSAGAFYQASAGMGNTLAPLILRTAIAVSIIVPVAEILPRRVLTLHSALMVRAGTIPLFLLFLLLYPVSAIFKGLSSFLGKNNGPSPFYTGEQSHAFNSTELEHFISARKDHQPEHANPDDNEMKLFRNALDFSKVKLREIMVPRTEIAALDIRSDLGNLRQKFIETGYSRILFYQDNIDNIIGYIHHSTIFSNPESIRSALKSVITVPETMSASKLLSIFIQQHRSIAIVVDEFGGTSGMVTSEDILEEIFGEIEDEHDTVDWVEKQLGENEFIFSARIDLDVLNEKYQLGFPLDEGYETLAGYILFHHESIPKVNTVISINQYSFKILKATNTRIELVNLKVLPVQEP